MKTKPIIIDNKDVTEEFMWFFAGLSMEEEKDCVELWRKYKANN